MEVYNKSAITVTPKKPFVDWNNKLTPEMPISEKMMGSSRTYLTNPDFEDAEKHLKKYFKQIFEEELEAMWTDEEEWPQKRDFKTFCEWFEYEISDWVVDLSKKPLRSEW